MSEAVQVCRALLRAANRYPKLEWSVIPGLTPSSSLMLMCRTRGGDFAAGYVRTDEDQVVDEMAKDLNARHPEKIANRQLYLPFAFGSAPLTPGRYLVAPKTTDYFIAKPMPAGEAALVGVVWRDPNKSLVFYFYSPNALHPDQYPMTKWDTTWLWVKLPDKLDLKSEKTNGD